MRQSSLQGQTSDDEAVVKVDNQTMLWPDGSCQLMSTLIMVSLLRVCPCNEDWCSCMASA